jgi:2-deoxy-D-gluconate 3-dehydrogenase
MSTDPDPRPTSADLFSLLGKTAVVTGASRGTGLAMATALAGAGADIIAVGSTAPDHDSPVGTAVT